MALQTSVFLCFSIFFSSSFQKHAFGQDNDNVATLHARLADRVYSVEEFGARGDDRSFDNQAFEEAWHKACSCKTASVLLVPNHKYRLRPIRFCGPCKNHITVKIEGTLEASPDPSYWNSHNLGYWILFDSVKNLVVQGGGTINGNGKKWWQKSCKTNNSLPCVGAPSALFFNSCKNLVVKDLKMKDSQQIHLNIQKSMNVKASNLSIIAPESSPNTDGIHVGESSNILIRDTIIRTGDDCISIVNGSRQILTKNIVCGPGHGISIGSLGAKHTKESVSNVFVNDVILKNTTNGIRIKTWQGGQGYAKDITFQNITMHNVKNPIIINQNYCDSKLPCHEQDSAVEVSHVLYKNIKGTSASREAMTFNCSNNVGCHHIVLQNIDLVGEGGEAVTSACNNFKWQGIGKIIPSLCA
ncbi:polygalacturonase-like [Zingiber officinale]|uniref:endo-polygalacturonase n=1 Tax=Zingiber officinale TaxID=94328 RepID=A0A8J5H339_ZINOF|nr:polygalacturonase-like [Zingiber officinale]KAG6514604.1 hypothetical protein ZIOFF_024972 [Zingiber officinale]